MGAGGSVQKGDAARQRPWVMICFAPKQTKLAKRIVFGLQEGGLLVKGYEKPADGSSKRLGTIAKAGAFLAVLSEQFVQSKACEKEFLHAVNAGLPLATVHKGTLTETPWLAASKVQPLDFSDKNMFEGSMALLMLQLSPHHVSDFAREMSTMGVERPKLREAEALHLLEQSRADPKASRAILREISGLSLHIDACEQLMQGNLVPLIIATVNAHTMSTDIALYMCWVLSHIVYCDASARNQIDSEGGTEMVVKTMQRHGANADIQIHGCTALQRLVVSDTIVACGGLDAVYKVISTHARNASAQLHAIRLLHAIVESDGITPPSMKKAKGSKSLKACKTVLGRYDEGTQVHTAAQACRAALL